MRQVRVCMIVLTLSLTSLSVLAQKQETVTNDFIIKMVKAGFSEDKMLDVINDGDYRFDIDTSPSGAAALKKEGVSERFISLLGMMTTTTRTLERNMGIAALRNGGTPPTEREPDSTSTNQLNRWNDLYLDKSTVQDALVKLGKPREDKQKQSLTTRMVGTVAFRTDLANRKDFRILIYKDIKGLKEVQLKFLDNILVAIYLAGPQQPIDPNLLPTQYSTYFNIYRLSRAADSPYYLVGEVTNVAYGEVLVVSDSSTIAKILAGTDRRNNAGNLQGWVSDIQLLSYRLFAQSGLDALK